jgi:hypothetical protein
MQPIVTERPGGEENQLTPIPEPGQRGSGIAHRYRQAAEQQIQADSLKAWLDIEPFPTWLRPSMGCCGVPALR